MLRKFLVRLAAGTLLATAIIGANGATANARVIYEDGPGFRCAVHGNHVCGPTNREGAAPGCYRNGRLVIPWTRFDDPTKDPLYAQIKRPC